GGVARLVGSILAHELRLDVVAAIVERAQRAWTLDIDAAAAQAVDEQALVLVLGKNDHVRKRTGAGADRADVDPRGVPALDPQIHRVEANAAIDDVVGDAELPIELERARMNDQCPRRRARSGGLVDNAYARAASGEPESERQAGRART